MCLGELARVMELTTERAALVDTGSREATVSLLTLDDPVVAGDWVLIHSGFALCRLTDEEARDAMAIRAAHTTRTTSKEDLP